MKDKKAWEWLNQSDLGYDIWDKKYRYNNESFDEFVSRICRKDEKLMQLVYERKFLFGGRALANRRTNKRGSMFNCYSSGYAPDNIEGLMQLNTNLALTYKAQGGQGLSLSKIRPKGTPIGKEFKSDGIVPFMEIFNTTTASISQGGARKGALMMSLDIKHKEAERFITIKSNEDKITKANLSLEIDDEFMKCVKDYYETGKIHKLTIKRYYGCDPAHEVIYEIVPIDLYKLMIKTVYDWGEPGCLFVDKFRNYNLMEFDSDYQIVTCNPCLTGDTIIAVADGRNGVAIKDLCNTVFPVYSARYPKNKNKNVKGDNWVAEIKNAKAFKTGTKHVITIQLSDGSEFRCTPDHKLALANGTYKEAKDCKGEQLAKFFTFSNKNTKKSYRHINSITYNKQYRLIAEYFNLLEENNHTIHHIDGDYTNDLPDNLSSISFEEHMKDVSECRKKDNPISRDINYNFNQGLRNISANAKRYNWSEERTKQEKEKYIETHQHLYVEKIDKNCYLNQSVTVVNVLDNNEIEDVYDLTVEDNHNFYIINNFDDEKYLNCSGVLVHNCGEQPLPANFSCNLGSINLSEFVINPYTSKAEFNFAAFEEAVTLGVKALDDIIDENLERHALKVQENNSRDYRNIGLGIMGYATALYKLGFTYGEQKALDFTYDVFYDMFTTALKTSNDLAKEKGMFPKCKPAAIVQSSILRNIYDVNDEMIENIRKFGLRNCSLLSIAPTGSIATMLGVSGGCEPEFALSYKRKTDNLKESYDVYCNAVNEYWKLTDDKIDINNIESLPDYFVTSKDIAPIDRIYTQGVMQLFVDTAISSTINLPKDVPIEDVEQIYLKAWSCGLKGITIYRSGCKREGILTVETDKKENDTIKKDEKNINDINKLPRGFVATTSDDLVGYKRKLQTGCGSIHMEVYADELNGDIQETFINIGSSGGCERNYQFISRLISTALRGGIPIECIIDQAKSIRPCTSYVCRTKLKGDTSPGSSCPYAIGLALQDLYEKSKNNFNFDSDEEEQKSPVEKETFEIKKETTNVRCPDCGEPLVFEGSCNVCKNCGWSGCDQ